MPAQRAQDGMTTSEPPITAIVVTGPTASGKSAAALRIATAFGGTVINADSMQVYRELRILTARPTPEEEAAAPHRLYGVLSAAEACSAGRWRGWAVREIAAASATGSLPVVVGGTGLYLKALLEGLAPIPDTPPEVRERVRDRLREQGAAALFAELAERDPASAERISPSDTQRLLRGLEVLEATGEPLSVWQSRSPRVDGGEIRALTLVLAPPREAVYAACDARFDRMLEAGALDEVARLAAMRLPPDLPAMRAVGVRDLLRHVAGEIGLPEARERAQRSTRQYAKRQMTWLRHQTEGLWFAEQFSESVWQKIFSNIREFLLTPRGLTE